MEKLKSADTGFRIDKILLIESSFFRINNVIFDETVKNDMSINVDVNVDGSTIIVAETFGMEQKCQDVEQVKVKVKMIGVFEVVGATEIKDLEEFGRVNGAAIIFPYIREQITSYFLKAGLGAIMLPPVNFTK